MNILLDPDARPVVGHRGNRAHAPENTIEAFISARRMGATALESDVWLTSDGVAVLDQRLPDAEALGRLRERRTVSV